MNIVFYVLAFAFISVFAGIESVLSLLFYLIFFALISISTVGVYNVLRGLNDRRLAAKVLCTIVVGAIFYNVYGVVSFLWAIGAALIITVVNVIFLKLLEKGSQQRENKEL